MSHLWSTFQCCFSLRRNWEKQLFYISFYYYANMPRFYVRVPYMAAHHHKVHSKLPCTHLPCVCGAGRGGFSHNRVSRRAHVQPTSHCNERHETEIFTVHGFSSPYGSNFTYVVVQFPLKFSDCHGVSFMYRTSEYHMNMASYLLKFSN